MEDGGSNMVATKSKPRTRKSKPKQAVAGCQPSVFEQLVRTAKGISVVLGVLILVVGSISTGVMFYLSTKFAKAETVKSIELKQSQTDTDMALKVVQQKADADLMRKDADNLQREVQGIKAEVKNVATDQKVLNENMTRLLVKMNVPPARMAGPAD
jgi:uncharacterized protein HemX